MRDTSVLQIDLSAIDHNMAVIAQCVGDRVRLCPIVKADAYGLGAPRLARRLALNHTHMFAVYTPEQAAELIRATVDQPILVLMPVWEIERADGVYRAMIDGRLHLTAHGAEHLDKLVQIASRFGCVLPVHVEVDTGMSRGGVPVEQVQAILRQLASNRWVRLAGLFTHYVESEGDLARVNEQLSLFRSVISENESLIPPDCLMHAANSMATLRHAPSHLNMVRVGLAWMGYGCACAELVNDLQPSVTWLSRVVHVKEIEKGVGVGYGSRWVASRPSRIALVPVGYADGYPIQCSSDVDANAPALVGVRYQAPSGWKRRFCPVVGAVNMDQVCIDITDLPRGTVGVGSTVELISPDREAPNHLPHLASRAGTIPHEILARINPRLRRVYLVRTMQIETEPMPSLVAV